MKTRADFIQDERGSLLVGSVIIVFFMVTFGLAFLKIGMYEANLTENRHRDLKAFWKGEEGLSLAAALLGQMANADGFQGQTEFSSDSLVAQFSITKPASSHSEYFVRSSVFKIGRADTLVALSSKLIPQTAGNYFFLEDHAGEPYYFTGDTIRGPVRTNNAFKVKGQPVFISDVFESGAPVEEGYIWDPLDPKTPPKIVSARGPVWNAPEIDFDSLASEIKNGKEVIQYEVDPALKALVELKGKALLISYQNKSDTSQVTPPKTIPIVPNMGLYFKGDVVVKGVLNGQLTIGAENNITIADDLIYQPGTNSMLGLISQNSVVVDQVQKGGDIGAGITIDASIVAVKGSFEVANLRRNGNNSMGEMHLLGSIAQYVRGIIGSVRLRGSVHRGYSKDWVYDNRLAKDPPPYFPPLTEKDTDKKTFKTLAWSRTI